MSHIDFMRNHLADLNLDKLLETSTAWSFRCPLCGDSESNPDERSGHLKFDWADGAGVYTCFRATCGTMSLYKFLEQHPNSNILSEFKKYRFRARRELELDDDYEYGNYKIEKEPTVETSEVKKEVFESKTIEELKFTKIEDDQLGIIEYLDSRGLNKKDFLYDAKTDRLVIPYYTKEYEIYYYQLRSLKENVVNKYMFDTNRNINAENRQRNIFNIYHIDTQKPIQLLEGAIDSLLVENAVGNSGIGNIELNIKFIIEKFKIPKDNIHLILDFDVAGFNMMNILSKEYYVFDWIRYFKAHNLEYSSNLEKVDMNKMYLDMGRVEKYSFEELKPFYVKYSKRLETEYKMLIKKFKRKENNKKELFKQ